MTLASQASAEQFSELNLAKLELVIALFIKQYPFVKEVCLYPKGEAGECPHNLVFFINRIPSGHVHYPEYQEFISKMDCPPSTYLDRLWQVYRERSRSSDKALVEWTGWCVHTDKKSAELKSLINERFILPLNTVKLWPAQKTEQVRKRDMAKAAMVDEAKKLHRDHPDWDRLKIYERVKKNLKSQYGNDLYSYSQFNRYIKHLDIPNAQAGRKPTKKSK